MKSTTLHVLMLLLAAAVICIPPGVGARTFTSTDGRTLEAEIASATPDMVMLKLASGQTVAVPVNRLSAEDQTFVNNWRKANPVAIKYAFASSFTKEKKDAKKREENNTVITTETWVCNMKIANRSGQTLQNVKVDYEIFYSEISRDTPVVRKTSGQTTIPEIKHLQELVLPTQEVKLDKTQLEGGYYYADGSRPRQKDSLEGMVIKLSHEGKAVYTWASSGVPAGRAATAVGQDSSGR